MSADKTDSLEDNTARFSSDAMVASAPRITRASTLKQRQEDPRQKHHACLFWKSWDRERWIVTLLGCASSSIVLGVRLWLDMEPLAYFIHAIIVFLDMILIHIFTHSKWLSASGEIVTYAMFLSYHYTHETVFELLETTLIAMLVSINMISARKDVMIQRDGLEQQVEVLETRNNQLMRRVAIRDIQDLQMSTQECQELKALAAQFDDEYGTDSTTGSTISPDSSRHGYKLLGVPPEEQHLSSMERMKEWLHKPCDGKCHMGDFAKEMGNTFFEYFLDGSAGVMYTSFLGLIISELVTRFGRGDYGYDKC